MLAMTHSCQEETMYKVKVPKGHDKSS